MRGDERRYAEGPFQVALDLGDGFALNQPLSAFALAVLEMLDPEAPGYALDVVSVIEATLDDPRPVLMAQRFEARGEAVGAMKADGMEYEERMDALDDVTWPRPLAEELEAALRVYRQTPPVGRPARPVAEVGRARDVRAGDDVRRVRRPPQAVPRRGRGAALPHRRLPRAALDRAHLGPHRGARRHRRVARRGGAAHRLQPARRVGGAGQPQRRAAHRGAHPEREPRPLGEPPRAAGHGAAEHVPPHRAGVAAVGSPRWPRSTAASPRTSGRPRPPATAPSTTTSAPARRRAGRRCSASSRRTTTTGS